MRGVLSQSVGIPAVGNDEVGVTDSLTSPVRVVVTFEPIFDNVFGVGDRIAFVVQNRISVCIKGGDLL